MSNPYPSLGKYKLVEEIGRGGMGAVYKGYDPLLDRTVAVKLLAPHLVWQKDFVERFMREARAAARLHHPNIIAIHDVGQEEANYYFVMDYMPGVSLKQLIAQKGRLAPAEALPILRQLADALDYAHSKGLVHRDVKPANVMFDERGQVVLTDFGIVKAAQETRLTATGGAIGTPHYMAPEQVQGKEIDARTDQYALGIIAFEMLTGRVPFDAETTTTIYYKQVHERPPSVLALCPGLPPGVEQVVNRALAKSPAERYGSCGELIRALEQTVARPIPPAHLVSPPARRPVAPPPSPARHLVPLAVIVGVGAALLLCGSLVAYLIVRSSKLSIGAPTPAPARPVAAAPTSAEASNALSPPAQPVAQPTGTPLLAATVTALVPAPAPAITRSPTPRASGQIVFSSARGGNSDLYITNMDGSGVTRLTTSPGQDEYPAVSPDGRRISFMSDRDGNIEIYVINRDGTGEKRLTVDSGEDRLPNWSPDGRQIIFISNRSGNFQLYVMDADGRNVRRLTHNTRRDGHASWSANDWIAFNSGDADDSATWEIYVIRADGSGERRLTANSVNDWSPNWSPDGRQILYVSKRGGKDDAAIWVMNADGSNPQLVYNNPGAYEWGAMWSPDGRYIAFNSDVDGKDNVYLLRLSDQKVTQLTTEGGTYPGWAP